MSIVNDALRKAGKESEINNQKTSVGNRHACSLPSPDKKQPNIINISLIIIAVLLGSFVLYKGISGPSAFVGEGLKPSPTSEIQSTLNNIEQKNAPRAMKSNNITKLNGIVYGDEGKWAIVNDKIVKEGDSLLGGEITSITKDLVKIGKKDGTEIVLGLK